MKRRDALLLLAGLPAAAVWAARDGQDLDNPYADVAWGEWEYLDSMSHQHQGQTDTSRDIFAAMGYRHFAFSNYYPSAPVYPLPEKYAAKHPEIVAAPNAEQHSYTDSGLHANSLGSMLVTGYGSSVGAKQCATSPIVRRFAGVHRFDEKRPWAGVYRLDVRFVAKQVGAETPTATLTVKGANGCDRRDGFRDTGPLVEHVLKPGNYSIYLRTTADAIDTQLVFDPNAVRITQYRLMQGTNRPWREMFRAMLDGEVIDGKRHGGLLYPDGGGITLNHPSGKIDDYLTMLDFDPRVLGIEVWNQLSSGFGSRKAASKDSEGSLHFYQLWDDILRTGRRCWGFFVKDHLTYGRGRNVLLVPKLGPLSTTEREAAALRAYRKGAFFGSVASLASNEAGQIVAPYDRSTFRFSRLAVKRDASGKAVAVEAAVSGNDSSKPNVQIRFVTDRGVAAVIDAPQGEFPLRRDAGGKLEDQFVRVEAFAYPNTHQKGQRLSAGTMRKLNVHEISRLHELTTIRTGEGAVAGPPEEEPIPIVDMLFSQPLRRV